MVRKERLLWLFAGAMFLFDCEGFLMDHIEISLHQVSALLCMFVYSGAMIDSFYHLS